MSQIYKDADKVLASNEGDEFHVVWAARRCLRLLNPKNNLVAVVVEGIAPADKASREGVLKADVSEYYGAETFINSTQFVMTQLKYSPLEKDKDWTASGILETFSAFAKDFNEKCDEYGENFVKQKATYLFVTNRPIAQSLQKALLAGSKRTKPQGKHIINALESLKKSALLSDSRFQEFSKLFKFQGRENDRVTQEWILGNEINHYLPGQDAIAPFELRGFVRKKGLITSDREPVRRHDVLRVLKIFSEEELLPAQPSPTYCLPENYIPRIQERDIAAIVIKVTQPIIIHAHGGVGKSIIALRLPQLMPKGSQSVVFDGFADGLLEIKQRLVV